MYVGILEDCFLAADCGKRYGYVQQWMLPKNALLLVVDNKCLIHPKSLQQQLLQEVSLIKTISWANVTCSWAYRVFYGYGNKSFLIAVTSNQPFRVQPKLININSAVHTHVLNDRQWYTNLSAAILEIKHFGAAGFAMEATSPDDYSRNSLIDKL